MRSSPTLVTGWKRLLFCLLGCCCVGLGYLGAILPGLPATPFVIAASYFFLRSSPRLHRGLRHSLWVGRVLHDWEEHRAVRRSVKITACCLVVTVVTLSLVFSGLPAWVKILITGLAAIGMAVVLSLPTVPKHTPREAATPQNSV
jgi:uncharacterized protein